MDSSTFICAQTKFGSPWLVLAFLFLLLLGLPAFSESKPMVIKPEVQFQRMDGFGGTGGNGCAGEIHSLAQAERTRVLDLLFGPDGARINILRSEVWWTGKRLPFTHPLYLSGLVYHFGEEENESAQFFLMRESQKRHEMIFSSCAWSPPPEWKTSSSLRDGELLPKRYEDFADYLIGYLRFYKAVRYQNVHLLSIQNNPGRGTADQGCQWSSDQLRDFVKILGRRIREQSIPTGIMLPEMRWGQAATHLKPLLENAEVRPLISHISAHSPDDSASARAEIKTISKTYNLKLWQSEFIPATDSRSEEMTQALELAGQILQDLVETDCSAWIYGPLLTAPGSKEQGIIMARQGTVVKATKQFWCFTQFSRFLPRDSVRISLAGGNVLAVAFRNPEYNGLILVIINASAEAVTENIELPGWSMEETVAYRTSENEDCLQVPVPAESGFRRAFAFAPRSVTTLLSRIRRVR